MEFVAFGIYLGSPNHRNGFASSIYFDTTIWAFMSEICLEAY